MSTTILMKKISFIFIAFVVACEGVAPSKEPKKEIRLQGKTFILEPEDDTRALTVQFMDSTCHMFEANQYHRPWRLVSFENSNTLVLGPLYIAIHRLNDSTLVGLHIGENDENLTMTEKRPKWELDEILGEWMEERWLGTEESGISLPPARLPGQNTIWPPYYSIEKDQILSYGLGVDSVKIQMDNSFTYITMESSFYEDFVGYHKGWRILGVSDSVLTIQRRFTKDFSESKFFSYQDSSETINLIKK